MRQDRPIPVNSGRNCRGEPKPPGKPFGISKPELWKAYQKVKANKSAPGG